MIARTEKRRAQQDEDPHRRENSESNTEYGHLLTPNSEFLLPRGYHACARRSMRQVCADTGRINFNGGQRGYAECWGFWVAEPDPPAFKDELPPPRRPRRLRRAFASAQVADRPSADEGP